MSGSDLLEAALFYVPRTRPLIPREKRPAVSDWPAWPATERTVREWWGRRPNLNVGIATGSGLVVLDVDPRAGGDDVLSDLEHEHGELPETVVCETGGGGLHFYFAGPKDLPSYDVGAGLEIKAAGRQVVAPPSVHPSGAPYRWRDGAAPGDVRRAPLPTWLIPGGVARPGGRPAARPVEAWVQQFRAGVREGDRHNAMVSFVGHLAAKWYGDEAVVREIALLVNAERYRPPLPTGEVLEMVSRFVAAEQRKRGDRRIGGAR